MLPISSSSATTAQSPGQTDPDSEAKLKAKLAQARQKSEDAQSAQEQQKSDAKIKELEAKLEKLKAEELKKASGSSDEKDAASKTGGIGNTEDDTSVSNRSQHNNLQKDPRQPGFMVDRVA